MLYQRFTQRARLAIWTAQEEAERLRHRYVFSEYLLLGLMRQQASMAVRVLSTLGIAPEQLCQEIERQLVPGRDRLLGDTELSPLAQRAVELAYDEARQLGNTFIGTQHLLLGLIRERESLAGQLLAQSGVRIEPVRVLIRRSLENSQLLRPADSPAHTLLRSVPDSAENDPAQFLRPSVEEPDYP
ncbi:MAG TPA: Clp protease N-terminal domain-containing protein [Chthonomonadaceae bacterium]|nr:Clp protease N-terminal domain-containing protein [Chthonomonadaceae bacterium]